MLGPHSKVTDSIKDVGGDFNALAANKIFIGLDDPKDAATKNDTLKTIKSFITGDPPIRRKYEDPDEENVNYVDMMASVNDDINLIDFDGGERRYMLIKPSDEKDYLSKDRQPFWDDIHKYLYYKRPCPHTLKAVTQFLREVDITFFNPENDKIITEEFRNEKRTKMPIIVKFFKDQYEKSNSTYIRAARSTWWKDFEKWIEDSGRQKEKTMIRSTFYDRLDQFSTMKSECTHKQLLIKILSGRSHEYTLYGKDLKNYLIYHQFETEDSDYIKNYF